MTRLEKVIWAAGFLDGEGYFTTKSGVGIAAAQVKLKPLEQLQELFGGNISITVYPKVGQPANWKDLFQWAAYSDTASKACQELLPYLIVKDLQAELLIAYQETIGRHGLKVTPAILEVRSNIAESINSLNRRGYEVKV